MPDKPLTVVEQKLEIVPEDIELSDGSKGKKVGNKIFRPGVDGSGQMIMVGKLQKDGSIKEVKRRGPKPKKGKK